MPSRLKEKMSSATGDADLFEWVEDRLENIGLNGKVYSRLIKSVLKSNLEEEEFELQSEHKGTPSEELLINEILLASMWKGNDKTDDYWLFKKVIMDFVNKYKSKDAKSLSEVVSSNDSDASDERYEEAFPSLSDACDEIAWNVPRWVCVMNSPGIDLPLFIGSSSDLLLSSDNNDDRVEFFDVTKYYTWRGTKLQKVNRRDGRRAMRENGGRWSSRTHAIGERAHPRGSFQTSGNKCLTSTEFPDRRRRTKKRFIGNDDVCFVSDDAAAMADVDEDNDDLPGSLVWNKNEEAASYRMMEPISMELLFPALFNKEDDRSIRECPVDFKEERCSDVQMIHPNVKEGEESRLMCFESTHHSDPSDHARQMRSFIPDYPWTSDAFLTPDGLKDGTCEEEATKKYPQSPRPYFHPDPPSYAPFPWDPTSVSMTRWHQRY